MSTIPKRCGACAFRPRGGIRSGDRTEGSDALAAKGAENERAARIGMADTKHHHHVRMIWTGSGGVGTTSYRSYGRDYALMADGKATLKGSADPQYRGDAALWNPEELLLASLSACHQLWYLHLCASAGVVVRAYEDRAESTMVVHPDGSGEFISVLLRPAVTIAVGSDRERALALHADAANMCFIARSVKFPVAHEPTIEFERAAP